MSLIALYLGIALWYTLMTPPGEGVDELPHFDYVLYLRTHQRMPVYVDGAPVSVWMAHHPPLYYSMGAGVTLPFSSDDREDVLQPNPHFRWSETGEWGWNAVLPSPDVGQSGTLRALYALRLMNLMLGATALMFIYLIVMRLLPQYTWAALGATALMGLNPSFIYMASTVHHDVLVVALFSAGLYWCVHSVKSPLDGKSLLVGGSILAALLLTKLSGLALLPIVLGTLLVRPRHPRDRFKRSIHLLIVTGVVVALAGWWFVRNQILYGDPVGMQVYTGLYHFNLRAGPFTWGIFVDEFLAQLGRTFWGAFGYLHILLPALLRQTVWAVTAIALAGWIFVGYRAWRGSHRWPARQELLMWAILLAAFSALFVFFVRFAVQTRGAGHGRYLLPVGATLGSLLIVGLNGYTDWRHQRVIALASVVVMSIYAIWTPYRYVWPKYQLAAMPAAAELEAAAPVDIAFEGGVLLKAVRVSDAVLIPGQGVDVVTYWSAAEQATSFADPYVHLSLVTNAGTVLGSVAFWPEIGTVPAVWGERIIASRHSFYIPPDQISGAVQVQVQVADGREGPLLPVAGADQTRVTLAEVLALGAVKAVASADVPAPPRSEIFAGVLHLAGTSLPASVSAGGVLPVELYWQVLDPVPEDYTVFIHVLDQTDQIIAQLDRPPGGGTSPTSTWQPGQILRDTYPVPLPTALPPGEYRVRMGLYTWPELAQQTVTLDDAVLGESVILGAISNFE